MISYENKPVNLPEDSGSYIVVDNKVWRLTHHPEDFSVIRDCEEVKKQFAAFPDTYGAELQTLANGICRVKVKDKQNIEALMENVRQQSVAHHIYQIEGSDEEVRITDRIILVLNENNPEELRDIMQTYKLLLEESDGPIYLLKVTTDSKRNPLKIANEIARRDTVKSCAPETLFSMQRASAPAVSELFKQQWYLTTEFIGAGQSDLKPSASINVRKAWDKVQLNKKPGARQIVIAVIDDGFDLNGHSAFKRTTIDPNFKDFVDGGNPTPGNDFHGTCVASLATANGDKMLGVAPDCALLPIRVDFNPSVKPDDVLAALAIASDHADVVNCSFETGLSRLPSITDNAWFMKKVGDMIDHGGLRKTGLIIVFAAGNSNAPIFIPGEENKNGVRFFKPAGNQFQADMIPAQQAVHAGYPEIPGVIVVGAMSSLKRKAFYSNWGRQLTVVAPSGNAIIRLGKEPGRGVIAANNRPGIGVPFPSSSGFDFEYTNRFGGTSAAAPIVAGVIGLMLSVNPSLRPEQVREILKETADIAELEFDLDMNEVTLRDFIEKNLQDFNRQFVSGHSILFGGGKVDADKAVQKAIDLLAAIQ
jgi:hypothetical protein